MIKEANYPNIKTVDFAMHPKVIDSRLMKKDMNFAAGKMDYSKGDAKKVTTKLKEVSMELKKAGLKGTFKGSLY